MCYDLYYGYDDGDAFWKEERVIELVFVVVGTGKVTELCG